MECGMNLYLKTGLPKIYVVPLAPTIMPVTLFVNNTDYHSI